MAKVRLTGAVNLEFEVKYGLDKDIELKVQAINFNVDGKDYKVLVGEGDISKISEKTLEFIGSRIEKMLENDKHLLGVTGFGSFFKYGYLGWTKDDKLFRPVFRTELGKLMLKAYAWRDKACVNEVLNRNLWFASESGIREFASLKKALQKAQDKGIDVNTAMKVNKIL